MGEEVQNRWPDAYWDEFMRRPDVRRGRHCLRPEINRSFTFGEKGTSGGQSYLSHLAHVKLNTEAVDWEHEDLSIVASAKAFENYLEREVRSAVPTSLQQIDQYIGRQETLRIPY